MDNTTKKILLAFLVLIIVSAGAYLVATGQNTPPPQILNTENKPLATTPNPESVVLPTKTPEEIKIISEIKDYNIEIKNNKLVPEKLTVNAHDQVYWTNKDTVDHRVKGSNWGGLKLTPGNSFMFSFSTPGRYEYTDVLFPDMKGTIIVE